MTRRSKRAAALVLAALSLISCARLFGDAIQCETDGDCARFGAVCNSSQGVCINPPPPESRPTGPSGQADAQTPDRCSATTKPTATIGTKFAGDGGVMQAEITSATTLGCDTDWVLDTRVFVRAGATLTIQPATTIRAKKGTGAGLVISRKARLVADATRDAPVVFTSDSPTPAPGDWDGIYLLGEAAPRPLAPYNGDSDLPYGGNVAGGDSGLLNFVRVEYPKNGLVFAGVGSGTLVDSIQVRKSGSDCFFFSGGMVDAKHLVCQSPADEEFETALGYGGRLQFLFGHKSPVSPTPEANGLLLDGSHPAIYNATLCGESPTAAGYGLVFRNNATVSLQNAIVTGWAAGLDARGSLPSPGLLRGSIFFGNTTEPAYVEDPLVVDPASPLYNDDNAFDEIAWFNTAGSGNTTTDPQLGGCFDAANPKPFPATSVTANAIAPPADGFFDPNAKYIGAFKDANDAWMTGAWVRFSSQ
jgi:hypothetical protein